MFLKGVLRRWRLRRVTLLGVLIRSCLLYGMYIWFQTKSSHHSGRELNRTRSSFMDSDRQVDIAYTYVNVSSISSRGSIPQVDIVYTWVNGSDPGFIADLDRFMYDHFNDDRNNVKSKIILLDTLVSVQELAAASLVLQQAKRVFPVKLHKNNKKFTAVEFTDDKHVSEALKTIFWINSRNISSSSCFYKFDASLSVGASVTLSNQILMKGLRNNKEADQLFSMFPKGFRMHIEQIDVYPEHDAAVLHVSDKRDADQLLKMLVVDEAEDLPKVQRVDLMCNLRKYLRNDVSGARRFADHGGLKYSLRSLDKFAPWVRHVFIVTNGQIPYWLNLANTQVSIVNHKYLRNDVSGARRFADHGGLKYSLRSLDKFAPWVRHVFIVTNGQIPYWLNLANTQVSIVNHKDIFQDESHLPTFASPAIEVNLHRIPGLSDKFIYLNDDWFFGKNVLLKDFYTDVTGEKVRIARTAHVRSCQITCLPHMVGNGVCDKACNTDLCDWDGGDCGGEPLGYFSKYITYNSRMSYTNSLYDHYFGYRLRKVSQHGPFIVDKNVMEELQSVFPDAWELTSSQKIRSHQGLQYQFAYLHFLIDSSSISMNELFEDLDVDDSKLLSNSEIQTMAKRIKGSSKTIVTLKQLLLKCCNSTSASSVNATNAQQIEQQFEKHVPQVTRYMFTHCRDFVKFAKDSFTTINKHKFSVTNDNTLLFASVKNNVKQNTELFQNIKLHPRKFVCINDGLDYGAANIESVIRHIHDQYELLFPVPSKYELQEPDQRKR